MNSERFFRHLVETLTTTFGEINQLKNVLPDHETETCETIKVCHDLHKVFYDHMCGISVEYNNIVKELETIEQELVSIQDLEVRNTSVLSGIKSTVDDLLKTLENYREKIEKVQGKFLTCKERANSEKNSLENENFTVGALQDIFQTVMRGALVMGVGTAGELIASEAVVGSIGTIGSPISMICIAGIFAAISQLHGYFKKDKKRKSLTDALNKVVVLLERLLQEADTFNVSHTNTIRDLETYLSSIDKTIHRFNEEEPLNISGLSSLMLKKTKDIQGNFESMKTQAASNSESLRKSLLDINPRSIINS